MDLKITNYNNFFKLKGILDKNTLGIFHTEFNHIFEKLSSLTISIEDIVSMDRDGVNAMAELHNEALARNKKLAIVGVGCEDLYHHFQSEKAA